jgi:hypothetical protein
VGIEIHSASCNIIYNNNFIENFKQVWSNDSINRWDYIGGNYWSDYTGVDKNGDGFGETQYFIDENNRDNYPHLMYPTIPEFSLPMLLALISLTSLTAFVLKKRKHF